MKPRLEDLTETGMVKYFFHSRLSSLPVRDVLNSQDRGFKTEPHIEKNAENYLNRCYQGNIKKFAESERKYLFLTTMRRDVSVKKQRQYIVGYLEKEKVEKRNSPEGGTHLAIIGPTSLYAFDDAILVADIFDWRSFTRGHLTGKPWVDERKTEQILEHFSK